MFHEIFRTKERKIMGIVLGAAILIIGILVIKNITEGELFVEKAVMAENYLETGDYEKAVETYLEALSVKGSDVESLSAGLADAYIGLNNYDKALEILNSCYQKTSSDKIKKKIEEVMSKKTDYEYLQSISRAEVYYSNKEYDKAISEYEKAKLIDSKKVTAYQRIAIAYIELGKYDLAKEEVLEGLEITQNEGLKETLELVNTYLLKAEYDSVVAQAEEYVYQENYRDAIKTYKAAVQLLPKESSAYKGLAEVYVSLNNYESAIAILKEALTLKDDRELDNMLAELTQYKTDEEEKKKLLSDLFTGLKTRDIKSVCSAMDQDLFREKIVEETAVFYGMEQQNLPLGLGMIIYDRQSVYYGDIKNGIREGFGLYVVLPADGAEAGYYYYEGKWSRDLPNGAGKTVEMLPLQNDKNENYESITVSQGYFLDAAEDGPMIKYFYKDDEETGRVAYYAENGYPMPEDDRVKLQSVRQKKNPYVIGNLYRDGKPTEEDYDVEPNTRWGVKTLMEEME